MHSTKKLILIQIISANNEIKIGVLLGLSGSSYESGITPARVLNKAVEDVNENFFKI